MMTRLYALMLGLAFILAGIGGFIPFITTPVGSTAPTLIIDASYGYLLGLFPINVIHNLFHLITGIFGLLAYRHYETARRYCQVIAVVLGIFTIMGLLPGLSTALGLMPLFGHDVWLHGLEALIAGYLGFFWQLDTPPLPTRSDLVTPPRRKISPILRSVTAFEVSVLIIAGGGLFLLPDFMRAAWPWPLLPFNTALLGAIYLASMVAALSIVLRPDWSPARVVMPMIAAFTLIVLAVSLMNLDRFTGPMLSTILWFVLYIGIPLNALIHLWLYRNRRVEPDFRMPGLLPIGLYAQALVFGVYGLALLLIPKAAGAFWPWAIDAFHAQMYSVAFITPAIGAWMIAGGGTRMELRTLGLSQIVGGLLPILGLVIVDQQVSKIAWDQVHIWAWISVFALILIMGVMMLYAARIRQASLMDRSRQGKRPAVAS